MRRAFALLLVLAVPAVAGDAELFEALRSPDAATRSHAFEQLKARDPVPRFTALRRILRELDDDYLLSSACHELGRMGPVAGPAIDDLVRVFYAPSLNARFAAVQALIALGPTAWKVRGLLAELRGEAATFEWLVDSALKSIGAPDRVEPDPLADERWRLDGRRLSTVGTTTAEMAAALDHSHPYVRHHACRALARSGPEGIEILALATRHAIPSLRLRAVRTLADSRDPAAMPTLLDVLRTGEARMSEIAIEGLGLLGSAESEAGILEALRDADLTRARAAITALERIRPGAADPVLRAWLDSPDAERSEMALQLICEGTKTPERFLPDLIQGLYTSRRHAVLRALALLGPRAAVAGPFLMDLNRGGGDHYLAQVIRATGAEATLADPFEGTAGEADLLAALRGDDWLLAGLAARHLGDVGREEVVLDALATGLRHPKPFVAACCLDGLEARGAAALPALSDALGHGSLELRRRAMTALTALGSDSVAAIGAVIRLLDVPELKSAATHWIEMIGPPAAAAAPKLMACYRQRQDRAGIGLALASLGEAGAGIIPDLIRDLDDEAMGIHPVLALRRFGPLAAAAAPRLGQIARERHDEVTHPRQHHIVIEAIAALPSLGEPGEAEIRALLESGNEALVHLVIGTYSRRKVNAELLQRIYWDLRDSESASVRGAARSYLRSPYGLKLLDESQLVTLFDLEPERSKVVAEERMRRSDIPGLTVFLGSERLMLRRAAVSALAGRKEEASAAATALATRLLDEPDARLRDSILQLLCDLEGKGAQAHVVEYARKYPTRRNLDFAFRRLRSWGDVAFLVGTLSDEEKHIRALAGKVLADLKPEPDEKMRKALVANLLDPKLRSSYSATIVASWGAEKGAPVFVQLLRSLKPKEYGLAVTFLEKMGADALPALRVALKDKHPTVRARAVYLVEKCGPAADEDLARVLSGDGSEEVRGAVVRAMTRRGAKAAPVIVSGLRDASRNVRNRAWSFFEKNREALPVAVPVLVRALTNGEMESETIQRLQSIREVALPALREAAKSDPGPSMVLALAELGELDERTLRPILAGDDEGARLRAVRLVAQLGPKAAASVRDLMVLLGRGEPRLSEEVARTLGCLRSAARPAVDRLLALRSASDSALRDAVAVAVTRIEHPPLVLVDLLQAGNSSVNDEVWRALRQGKIASLPELMALAECKDTDIARKAIPLIGELGPVAKAAIPVLKRVAANRNIGGYANAALAKIQPK